MGPDHPRVLLGHRGHRLLRASAPRSGSRTPARSAGRICGDAHILDEDGTELPPGEVGQIWFESGRLTFEYHNDPEKTAPRSTTRGWSTLGDVGYLDDDGYLYLTDRKSHMIISGGVNIYPQEVEDVLAMHPAVADVAVIGVPDPEMGEEVKAVVQPADPARRRTGAGRRSSSPTAASSSPHYKCPRSVDFVDELPRLPTGKLLKRELRERYWPPDWNDDALSVLNCYGRDIAGQGEPMNGTDAPLGDCPVDHYSTAGPRREPLAHFRRLDELRDRHRPRFFTETPPGYYVFLDHDMIVEGLQHPETFSSSVIVPEVPDPPYKWIPVMLDPPEHGKWRHLLASYFSPRTIERMADEQRPSPVSSSTRSPAPGAATTWPTSRTGSRRRSSCGSSAPPSTCCPPSWSGRPASSSVTRTRRPTAPSPR